MLANRILRWLSVALIVELPFAFPATTTSSSKTGDTCHLPHSVLEHPPRSYRHLKFVEFSCSGRHASKSRCTKKGGIGNTLVLFPAVYLFAMVTGRHLIINDNSAMGGWCRGLNCSFPFTSEVENVYPKLKQVEHVNSFNYIAIAESVRENMPIPDVVVGYHGMNMHSTRWVDDAGPKARRCIEKITGCNVKLLGCLERFAYQSLLQGFRHNVEPTAVSGLNHQEFEQILRSPHYSSLPRFDAGVHIRAQTKALEKFEDKNYTTFDINMKTQYRVVFQELEKALSSHLYTQPSAKFNISNSMVTGSWPRVYISCDDTDVRNAFISILLNRTFDSGKIIPVFVNTSQVKHTRYISFDSSSSVDQSLVDAAFDWYALSLCRGVFAWRVGYATLVSTFMLSATRVSMVKPTSKDFKAKVLHKNLEFVAPKEYIDNIDEVEMLLNRSKNKINRTI